MVESLKKMVVTEVVKASRQIVVSKTEVLNVVEVARPREVSLVVKGSKSEEAPTAAVVSGLDVASITEEVPKTEEAFSPEVSKPDEVSRTKDVSRVEEEPRTEEVSITEVSRQVRHLEPRRCPDLRRYLYLRWGPDQRSPDQMMHPETGRHPEMRCPEPRNPD